MDEGCGLAGRPGTVHVHFMAAPLPRLGVRALILFDDRLLLVNAHRGRKPDIWCAPGGGVERGMSLPENLIREVHEETGLSVAVGPEVLVNEFHDPERNFHQVDIYFRCTVTAGHLHDDWPDPAGVVTARRLFAREALTAGDVLYKPDLLPRAAWGNDTGLYDPLEVMIR